MNVRPAQDDRIASIEAGAYGHLLRDANVEDLVGASRRVAQGTAVLPAPLASTPFSRVGARGPQSCDLIGHRSFSASRSRSGLRFHASNV
jgi:DNA-binding NarL/FixJ family response regulator